MYINFVEIAYVIFKVTRKMIIGNFFYIFFSIIRFITFANYGKIANNLAKAFKKFKPLKF